MNKKINFQNWINSKNILKNEIDSLKVKKIEEWIDGTFINNWQEVFYNISDGKGNKKRHKLDPAEIILVNDKIYYFKSQIEFFKEYVNQQDKI